MLIGNIDELERMEKYKRLVIYLFRNDIILVIFDHSLTRQQICHTNISHP